MVHDIIKVALCGYVHPIVDTVTSHFLANEPIVPFKSRHMLFSKLYSGVTCIWVLCA